MIQTAREKEKGVMTEAIMKIDNQYKDELNALGQKESRLSILKMVVNPRNGSDKNIEQVWYPHTIDMPLILLKKSV